MRSNRIGEISTNTQGYGMKICEYANSKDVTIKFIGHEDFRF